MYRQIKTFVESFYHSKVTNKNQIIRNFHNLYYSLGVQGKTWASNSFLGTPVQKCPFDLFEYQSIIHEKRPELIIECGTAYGGSALFMATNCETIGLGEIVSIDINKFGEVPQHKRITYIYGSSVSAEVLQRVRQIAKKHKKVMVILDSDHSKEHVLNELDHYHHLVTPGQYLIVEDTNVNGHPVRKSHGPGPMEALNEFLNLHPEFKSDRSRESNLLTFNPRGYLLKTD
jgi:cephalosporin hydroxylase